ncbi:MAG: D-glycerate dehydrogenase [Chloroflexi bacterium]|nr:D-glycerate dehydrogenase [Chloroflexota bacterium]
MPKPKVLITRRVHPDALRRVEEHAEVDVWTEDRPMPREELLKRVGSVEGLYTMLTDRVDEELLERAPHLRVVSNMAVGYDNIDVDACTRRGIPVGHTPGVLTDTTADLAFALILAAARRLVEGVDYVRAGHWHTWSPDLLLGYDVYGATLGILGLGRIAAAVARRAQGFGMRVLYTSRRQHEETEAALGIHRVDLDTLLREADILSIHTPLTPETYHLIGETELRRMKPTAILVNTARGGVVDPDALYRALKEGWIAYAALDVTEPEPIPADHPLLRLPNCIVLPHIGSATHATRRRMALMAAENLLAGLRGEPLPHCVNCAQLGGPYDH